MIQLPGYFIKEEIYSGRASIVYRGEYLGQSVVVKVLNKEYPKPSELDLFKKEFNALQKFHISCIVRAIKFEKYKNTYAIVYEDIGAEALSNIFPYLKSYSIDGLLKIMIKSAKALGEIHRANLIHKDINAHNIVLNIETGELQIIDFGSVSFFSRENPAFHSKVLEGTIGYISPEQTGRMNRMIDYRTDFYSLGVTFYELLTGNLPFTAKDPMEIIHSHIAIMPNSVSEKKTNIPNAISDIIKKLLSKTPEDRYQTAAGLCADLEWCLESIVRTHGTNENSSPHNIDLQIGAHDISDQFQIPEFLYGRAKEIEALISAFKIAISPSDYPLQLLVVSGKSGIGKSRLVYELNKPITEHRGYFLVGKFEQYGKIIPYSAIIQAFKNLISQILSESKEEIDSWKKKWLIALGTNAQVIIDVIPELELVIGKQNPIVNFDATDQLNRFQVLFPEFIKVAAEREHPLVIFLDDLQWVDMPSLNLLKEICINQNWKNIFFVLSYRDDEVDTSHPVYLMLEEMKKKDFNYRSISLEPLGVEDITSLIYDSLHSDSDEIISIARVVKDKTGGNPFFVIEFLKSLHKESIIYYDQFWKWDLRRIKEAEITENIVGLMANKFVKLSNNARLILKIAACFGINFSLVTIANLLQKSLQEVEDTLSEAAHEGMIFIQTEEARFAHDRIQEAIYSRLDEEEGQVYHYQIGKSLLMNTHSEKMEDMIFLILSQLNMGKNFASENEKIEIVRLNLRAAKKAKISTTYNTALSFLMEGESLLPENKWEIYYDLTLEFYIELAECEYLMTNFEESDKLYEYIYLHAINMDDKFPAYNLQLRQKASESKPDEAFQIGFQVLRELGLNLPNPLDKAQVEEEFFSQLREYDQILEIGSIEELLYLPKMKDANMIKAISLITNLGDIAIAMKFEMLPFLSILGVNISLKYGNASVSAISYVMWGVIINLLFQHYKQGYALGQLSLKLNLEKFPSELIYAKVYAFYGWNINHWIHPVKEDMDIATHGYALTMKNSDLVYASYFILMSIKTSFYIGLPLKEVIDYCQEGLTFSRRYKMSWVSAFTHSTQMISLALQGYTNNPTTFNNLEFDEERFIQENKSFGQPMVYFYLRKFQLYYLFGEYENCNQIFSELKNHIPNIPQHIAIAEYHFFKALYLVIFLKHEKKEYQESFQESLQLLELWADHSKENFLAKYLLVKAEVARVENQILEAMDLYDAAFDAAALLDYTNDLALISELTANFYFGIGKSKLAIPYLRDSLFYYYKWGAVAKAKSLESQYSNSLRINRLGYETLKDIRTTTPMDSSLTITVGLANSLLDFNTILKASQALSTEIEINKLLSKLMKILLENSGAERGFLLLVDSNSSEAQFRIEAEGIIGKEIIEVVKHKKISEVEIAESTVNYVSRTNQSVVLSDACMKGNFIKDPYIQKYKVRSILCYPLLLHGKLSGIIYLENRITSDVFTVERLELLNILSVQIVISVENSLLYSNLEQKVKDRTEELEKSLKKIEGLAESRKRLSLVGQMASGIVHDIKNPMAAIKGFAEMASSEMFTKEEQKEYLELISREIDKLNDMTYEILDFSKGTVHLDLKEYDARDYLTEIYSFLLPDFKAMNIRLDLVVNYSGKLLIDGDRIRRVILNIAKNAREAMVGQIRQSNFKIRIKEKLDNILIELADNGPGLASSLEEKIFEAFATEGKLKGTGLGLFMSKWIVDTHGGELSYETVRGLGTTFFISLPNVSRALEGSLNHE